MPTLGYCRVSTEEQVLGCKVQQDMILDTCARLHLGEPLVIWDDGVSTSEVAFNERPGIIRLLRCLRADDHLVVWRLDRIERGFLTFYDALRQIVERDVWIHSIEEKGGQAIDLDTAQGRAFVAVLQIGCDMYRETVKENTRRALEWRRKNGMAVSQTGFARRIVVRDRTGNSKPRPQFDKHAGDVKLVEWDTQQLAYISEIAERLGRGEDVAHVAADFWARGLLDHRGLPWGQVQAKPGKGTGNRYEWYRRAARWFHRAKHKGELPPPYRELAGAIPEPKGFTLSKRPKKRHTPTVLPAGIERMDWTAEDWLQWYVKRNGNGNGHPEGSNHG